MAVSCDMLVFGGTGDLALHKLLPALYHLHCEGRLACDSKIIGLARQDFSQEHYQALVERHCRVQIALRDFDESAWQSFCQRLDYLKIDAAQTAQYSLLRRYLSERLEKRRVYYLAVAPTLFSPIVKNLALAGLASDNTRVVIEKPIGHSLASAQAINTAIGEVFNESQVFRIDHYLGKEAVQNLLALRFGNALFEPLWRGQCIDHVQISVCETLGVENRGAYYEQAGAMRDMVQNHLLQLLCLVAMEAPKEFAAEAVRDEKVKILKSLKPIQGQDVLEKTVRGQYTKGLSGGHPVPAYYFEKSVDNDSDTETFVALEASVDNWRWAGVPFYLRTGKRLAKKASEIIIQFKAPNHLLFEKLCPNRLVIRLQPDESIELELMTKAPGRGMVLEPSALNLNLGSEPNEPRRWDAYQRLLLDTLEGDSTLFMRRDEVEAAWAWVDPILKGWQVHYQQPRPYPAGSDGPEQAMALLEHQGRQWY